MSRRGLIVVVVIAVAVIASVYYTYEHGSLGRTRATPAVPVDATIPSSELATRGAALFVQYHCTACHTIDGRRAAGPTLAGLYGSQVLLNTGQTVVADDGYLTTSILDPDAQIVKGYGASVMSAALADFTTQISEDDTVKALVAYIESLKEK